MIYFKTDCELKLQGFLKAIKFNESLYIFVFNILTIILHLIYFNKIKCKKTWKIRKKRLRIWFDFELTKIFNHVFIGGFPNAPDYIASFGYISEGFFLAQTCISQHGFYETENIFVPTCFEHFFYIGNRNWNCFCRRQKA